MDKRIILWDIPEALPVAEFTGHTDTVHSLRFSRDGHILASGSFSVSSLFDPFPFCRQALGMFLIRKIITSTTKKTPRHRLVAKNFSI